MLEARKVKFATMELVNQARLFWTNLENQELALGLPAINTWARMKKRLSDKYLPRSYQEKFLDQRNTFRKGNLTVAEYITKFDDLN